jgi:hypothetical protein
MKNNLKLSRLPIFEEISNSSNKNGNINNSNFSSSLNLSLVEDVSMIKFNTSITMNINDNESTRNRIFSI